MTEQKIIDNTIFRSQIAENIVQIQDDLDWDDRVTNVAFAFNYWILTRIYNLDLEVCESNITDYSDKGVDCYVHYEEDKELYLIQNKYYSDDTRLSPQEVSSFVTRPLAALAEGNYTRSKELQNIYDKAVKDSEYKIFLHLYITNDLKKDEHQDILRRVVTESDRIDGADIFYLSDIKDKFYGKSYKATPRMVTRLTVKNKATCLAIRPAEYQLDNMEEAYYLMAKVSDVYRMLEKSEKENYPLFEENIREYLGAGSINKKIIETLNCEAERHRFFYYNNGITITCDAAKVDAQKAVIHNPQIINGCQTVNSISEVLKHEKNLTGYEDVYLMAKIIVIPDDKSEKNKNFFKNVVQYTNSQNAVNQKVFASAKENFMRIKSELKQQGFLLGVKQSDNYQFKVEFKDKKDRAEMVKKAQELVDSEFYSLSNRSINDIYIGLDTLLQITSAFREDAYYAYTKKSDLLKMTSSVYRDFSSKIHEYFTCKQLIVLIMLYKKAETERRKDNDKKFLSPFYVLNFLGCYLEMSSVDKRRFLENIQKEQLKIVYRFFEPLPLKYMGQDKDGYNAIIKRRVNLDLMKNLIENELASFKQFALPGYNEFISVFESMKQ